MPHIAAINYRQRVRIIGTRLQDQLRWRPCTTKNSGKNLPDAQPPH